jgi:hypothetical protein
MQVEISGYAWLDRAALTPRQVSNIVDRLTIQPKQTSDVADETPQPIQLYRLDEARNKIGVPRGFYKSMANGNNTEEVLVSYGAPMRPLTSTATFTGRFAEQATAIDALLRDLLGDGGDGNWGGALLQAQPAFGKTVVALEVARRLGRRTLILVHQDFFVRQWTKRIRRFLPDARIGIIRQDKCEYELTKDGEEPDFVIALLQSLTRDDGDRYPAEMYQNTFGLVISDETHRLGAATWGGLMPKFSSAYRLGLTATPRRRDGAENVFFYHISQVTYEATTESVRPRLRRLYTDTMLRAISRGEYKVKVDNLNSAQIINQLCADATRTRSLVDDIVEAVRNERKIIVVSSRLDHLRDMMDQTGRILRSLDLPFVPVLDAYTGQWFTGEVWSTTTKSHRKGDPKLADRTEEDLDRAESANAIFATQQMVLEGLDIPALDVIMFTTPISDVQQGTGRVQRECVPSSECVHYCPWRAGRCTSKPEPIVTDVVDERIPRLRGMAARRERFYKTCCTM